MKQTDELHSLRPDMDCSCLSINAAAEDAPMLIFEKNPEASRYLEQARKKKRTRD